MGKTAQGKKGRLQTTTPKNMGGGFAEVGPHKREKKKEKEKDCQWVVVPQTIREGWDPFLVLKRT